MACNWFLNDFHSNKNCLGSDNNNEGNVSI